MVTVYADINCPFCFVLNEWLHEKSLIEQVDWVGVEHEPELNDERAHNSDYQRAYHMELDSAKTRADGVDIGTPDFRPSSHVALKVLAYIKDLHLEIYSICRRLIYRALWLEGQDISKLDVLKHVLGELVDLERMDSDLYSSFVEEQTQDWRALQYDRIPMALASSGSSYLGLGNKDALASFVNSGLFDFEDESVCLEKNTLLSFQEDQLRSFPLMREMLELTVDPIFLLDNEGRIKLCNGAACTLLAKSYVEIIGLLLGDVFPGASVSDLCRLVKMNYAYGSCIWELVSNRLDSSSLVLTMRDVTVRERQTAELQRKNVDLVRALKAKEDFLAVISHEMRTPLNGVIGLTEVSREEQSIEQLQQNLKKIDSSGRTLLAIINDLLDYSSLANGKLSFTLQVMNLKSEIESVLSNMSQLIEEKNNQVEVRISDDVKHWVKCDPVRFKQLIFNLVGNANKFTSNGLIKIVISMTSDNKFNFEVIDNGSGIAQKDVPMLFKAFSKVQSCSNSAGTGLGLVICKSIVEYFDGRISVDSQLEQGANFHFTLKLKVAEEELTRFKRLQSDDSELYTSLEKPNILIAEDNKVNQLVLKKMLLKYNLEADIVEDGEAVLQAVREKKYCLIFMDQNMPKLNGIATTKKLREQFNTSWIIGCSASSMERERVLCFEAGMNDFLSKPTTLENLKDVLIKHRDRQKGS